MNWKTSDKILHLKKSMNHTWLCEKSEFADWAKFSITHAYFDETW